MNRNYVYAFPSVHGTCNVVNYSGIGEVNDFLHCFDVWGSYGNPKSQRIKNRIVYDFWFECSKECFETLHTDMMKRAFKRMGVELVFEYPFKEEFEKC